MSTTHKFFSSENFAHAEFADDPFAAFPRRSNAHSNTDNNKKSSSVTKDKVERDTRNLKRLQWFIIFIICLGLSIFQTGQCAKHYIDKETGTADKYVHLTTTSFPVMTICPTYPYKLDKLQNNGIKTRSDIQFNAKWVSNDSTVDPVAFYKDVVFSIDEVLKLITLYVEAAIGGVNQFTFGPEDVFCGEKFYRLVPYYYNGDCFAITMPKCIRDAGVLEMDLDFFNHTDIFIHHTGQYLSANSRSRVDVDRGNFVKIAVNHEVVQLLGHDGSCTNDFGDDIDFDGCIFARLRDISMKELNCTVPWLPDKSHICTDPVKSAKAFDLYQKNRRNQMDICPSSCLFTNMYFGPPVTGLQNVEMSDTGRAIFYFRRDIKNTTEYYLYSALSMLAEIGGYVGLFLGTSLFHLVELNNFLIEFFSRNKIAALETKENGGSGGKRSIRVTEKPSFHM